MWTPADWAWAGGLLNALFPSLMVGRAGRSPGRRRSSTRRRPCASPPWPASATPSCRRRRCGSSRRRTAPGLRYTHPLRSIMSAGETLGPDTYAWAREAFGFPVDELYGQTECNLVLGSSAALGVSRPATSARLCPGIASRSFARTARTAGPARWARSPSRRPDPVMFLSLLEPAAGETAAKFRGRWMLTGDQAVMDGDGYVRFAGRDDDLITSSGYRIGPGEIEDCLMRHPAIAMAAAVGKPDALRTEIVKAFLVLKPGIAPSDALTSEVQAFVRTRLSAHEYPREVIYVPELPLTSTGKIIRRELRARG